MMYNLLNKFHRICEIGQRVKLEICMTTQKQLNITHQKNTPEKILNKVLIFGTLRIDEEKIFDKTIESLPADNDDIYILNMSQVLTFLW